MDSIVRRLLENKKVSMTIRDNEQQIQGLLEVIESYTQMGHSFSVVVDPDNSDYEKKFYIDGDGSDRLDDLQIGEEESED